MSKRLLIIGPSWVGDMVMAQVLFKLLHKQFPDGVSDVLAPQWSKPLLARMPEVRHAIDLPFTHGEFSLHKRRALGHSLRRQYDQAIVLPNSWKSALPAFFARIPQRTGWRGEMRYGLLNDVRTLDKQRYPLMIDRFAALAFAADTVMPKHLPWPAFSVRDADVREALHALHVLPPATPVLALCPGAEFGPAKRWPERHYAAVAKHYLKLGWRVWLFGSKNDAPVAAQIIEWAGGGENFAGRTTLGQAIDLMSLATQVVSNDSGLMHIAAALNRPLVVPFGSSSPKFTPPLTRSVKILQVGLDCSPCFKRECPLVHMRCLNELMPEQVLEAIKQLQMPQRIVVQRA